MKQSLLLLHHWNYSEKSLTDRDKDEAKKKTLFYKKQNRDSNISIDHVDNNSNSDRFYYRIR